jgi:hypothetical protein
MILDLVLDPPEILTANHRHPGESTGSTIGQTKTSQ